MFQNIHGLVHLFASSVYTRILRCVFLLLVFLNKGCLRVPQCELRRTAQSNGLLGTIPAEYSVITNITTL
jgi:hypothetical protein